jgi:hypothetical protein
VSFHLSFLDDERRVKEVWEADFENEHTAICWMWMAGGVRALKHDWSTMELLCRRCSAGQQIAQGYPVALKNVVSRESQRESCGQPAKRSGRNLAQGHSFSSWNVTTLPRRPTKA